MDIEFHYYLTYLIAARAGLPPPDALTLAWACQYTDDNTMICVIDAGLPTEYTNYISQTVIGLIVLRHVFAFGGLTRWQITIFVAAVWALELAWSKPWLTRFRYGPLEWAWRTATYRKRQPFRREPIAVRASTVP